MIRVSYNKRIIGVQSIDCTTPCSQLPCRYSTNRRRTTEKNAGELPYLLRKIPQVHYDIYYRQRYHKSSGVLRYLLQANHIYHHQYPPDQTVGDGLKLVVSIVANQRSVRFIPTTSPFPSSVAGLSCPATGRRRCSGCRTYLLLNAWVYTTSDDVTWQGLRPPKDPTLRDGAQKTKTQAVAAVGDMVPVTVGNTRDPRIAVPAPTPRDESGE